MAFLKEKLQLKIEEAEIRAQGALGQFPPWQKWLILICLVSALPAFFLAKALGNAYFAKQYRQYLITAQPSFSQSKNLIIDRIDIATLGADEYAVVAQLINPNLDLSAKQLTYEFEFFSNSGAQATLPQKGEFYILPNQRKYLVASKVLSAAGIAKVKLNLPNQIRWQKKLDLPEVKLTASQPKGYDQTSPFGYALEGYVTNNSPFSLKEVRLTFLLFGPGGKVIGGSQRSEFSLKPFETRAYKQIWAGISGRNVVRAETHAETNLLDKENLTAPEFPVENGAGDLGR